MLFLSLIVFVVGYYLNTRYIFQGLLLPPGKMKKFLLIVHVLFYSILFLGILFKNLPIVPEYFPMWIYVIILIAVLFIFFILSFLGTYYGSRIAKKQLTAVWDIKNRVR
jgi:ABC-type multidrug transport system fused ATPase/permease subunit